MLLGIRTYILTVALAVVVSGSAYFVGANRGHKQGYDAGYALADNLCKEKEKKWQENIIQMQNDQIKIVMDGLNAVDAATKRSAEQANRLNKKIGELREQASFASNPDCALSADELRYLREAYGVRDGADTSHSSVQGGKG